MANLNSVMLIGRLTRDPEAIASGKGAKFGFAVNNRKLNTSTQQWEDVPVFLDCEIWNRGESTPASRLLQSVKKGQQLFIEGHLKMDSWEDRNGGGKRTAIRIVVDNFQYLEAKEGATARPQRQATPQRATPPDDEQYEASSSVDADDIPF